MIILGESGIDVFQREAEKRNICIAIAEKVPSDANDAKFNEVRKSDEFFASDHRTFQAANEGNILQIISYIIVGKKRNQYIFIYVRPSDFTG